MSDPRPQRHPPDRRRPGVGETRLEDIRRGDLHRSVCRDLQDAYRFHLDEESRRPGGPATLAPPPPAG